MLATTKVFLKTQPNLWLKVSVLVTIEDLQRKSVRISNGREIGIVVDVGFDESTLKVQTFYVCLNQDIAQKYNIKVGHDEGAIVPIPVSYVDSIVDGVISLKPKFKNAKELFDQIEVKYKNIIQSSY
jgi:sporulation protein YlmC with PRC-barrel domain